MAKTEQKGAWSWTDNEGHEHRVALEGPFLEWSREDQHATTKQTREAFALNGPPVECPDRITRQVMKAIGATGMSWRAS